MEVPLVEEQELYTVGYGPVDSPLSAWSVSAPQCVVTQSERDALAAAYGPQMFWVKQVDSYGESPARYLVSID